MNIFEIILVCIIAIWLLSSIITCIYLDCRATKRKAQLIQNIVDKLNEVRRLQAQLELLYKINKK